MRIRILGIGSPFGADRIGWEAVDHLSEQYPFSSRVLAGVELDVCDRPGVRLLDYLAGADLAILIDAVRAGGPVGAIRRLTEADIALGPPGTSSHGFGVAEALALGRALGPLPEVVIFGIEVGTGEENPPVDFGELVAALEAEVLRFSGGGIYFSRLQPPGQRQ